MTLAGCARSARPEPGAHRRALSSGPPRWRAGPRRAGRSARRGPGRELAAGSAGASGFPVGIGPIPVTGAQNAFVLRQGLPRGHAGAVLPACGLSDAPPMTAGGPGPDAPSGAPPWPGGVMRPGGAAFLTVHGALRVPAVPRGGQGAFADRRPGGPAGAGAGDLPACCRPGPIRQPGSPARPSPPLNPPPDWRHLRR